MKRQIKFRGKTIDTERWVYGYFYEECDNTYIIENRQKESMCNRNTPHLVLSETVGQFTGLKDKNGNDIFEGDILESLQFKGHSCIGVMEWDERQVGWRMFYPICDFIIVGNKFDNPELMK